MSTTKNTKKDKDKLSKFEEMLMWTSYRYCIGRHTYVTTMAYEIGKNFFDKLSPERREFTSKDIKNELSNHLSFADFNFGYDGIYGDDRNTFVDFMRFLRECNVSSADELATYRSVRLVKDYNNYNELKWEVAKTDPVIKRYPLFSAMEIDDLIPWSDLAEYFDTKSHRYAVCLDDEGKEYRIECYRSYEKKCVPCEDRPGYCHALPFGWDEVWRGCDKFGEYNGYICTDSDRFVRFEDIEKSE